MSYKVNRVANTDLRDRRRKALLIRQAWGKIPLKYRIYHIFLQEMSDRF